MAKHFIVSTPDPAERERPAETLTQAIEQGRAIYTVIESNTVDEIKRVQGLFDQLDGADTGALVDADEARNEIGEDIFALLSEHVSVGEDEL